MKIVKVSYSTKPEYAAQNQRNIQRVMEDIRKAGYSGINYHACLCADGKTFIHTAFMRSEEDQKLLNELPSFKEFQEQLKASGPETPPKPEQLTLVGSTVDFFH